MPSKFATGKYNIKNPKKYVGTKAPTFRSSWEYRVFQWLDETPGVISWASEPIKIPYQNPFTGKASNYIPDLLFTYLDKTGVQRIELVEIKPLKETLLESAKSKKDKIAYVLNQSKWASAQAWAKHHGAVFRVLTEKDIFGISKKNKKVK